MNKINISDVKTFMSKLLIKEDFDNFLLKEATINTFSSFNINGRINENYYTKEEFEALHSTTFSYWSAIKPVCFNLIKGNKLPLNFKIVLKVNDKWLEEIIASSGSTFTYADVEGLFINIKYENNTLDCITATSLYSFSTDKTLEHYWDKISEKFLLALF